VKKELSEIVNLKRIKEDITSDWLPIEDVGVLMYRQWVERFNVQVENAIVWLKTTEIDEAAYFTLLENFFPEGLATEDKDEHSRLFNMRYKGIRYHLCELSRHPVEGDASTLRWELGQSRRRVIFNKAFTDIPTNNDIELFLNSHWNVFYYELRKHPDKYTIHRDDIDGTAWKKFNSEEALKKFVV